MNRSKKSEDIGNEIVTISRHEYEQLKNENNTLKQQINWLEECLKLRNKKIFGSSSEKINSEDQVNFFNEMELFFKDMPEPELTEVKKYYRKQHVEKNKDRLPENLPVEIVEHTLDEALRSCSDCGQIMHSIGKETVREELKIIPAKAVIVRHMRYSYACRNCEKNGVHVPIVKAKVPNSPVKGGFASPEIVAYIMSQKYVLDLPLYRQEQDFNRKEIMLSRQTMCNWLMKCSEKWLKPIHDALHKEFLASNFAHADETVLQVLKEPGKKAQSKSYMWLYRTGNFEERQIALYDYEPSRSAKHVQAFLEGFSGYLHCDAYQAYKTLPENIRLVGCLAHTRRKFSEAVECLTPEQRKTSKSLIGLKYCEKLFAIEKNIKECSPETRYLKRQELSNPVLDEFFLWLNSCNAAPKSHLGRAIAYTLRQWNYLVTYLQNGMLEISNNNAEHLAKSFAVCRKNFLFSNTPRGADASAITYSVIATAMANNLDPFEYLTCVFKNAPNMDLANVCELKTLLPWSENMQKECKVK